MTAAAQTTGNEPATLDTKPVNIDYQPTLSAPTTSTVIPKTVDYGHGHGMNNKYRIFSPKLESLGFQTFVGDITCILLEPGATVERISYGERIVLRPDPVPLDRGYEKGESKSLRA